MFGVGLFLLLQGGEDWDEERINVGSGCLNFGFCVPFGSKGRMRGSGSRSECIENQMWEQVSGVEFLLL